MNLTPSASSYVLNVERSFENKFSFRSLFTTVPALQSGTHPSTLQKHKKACPLVFIVKLL